MIRLYKYGSKTVYTDFPDYTFSRYNYAIFDFTGGIVTIEGTVFALPPEVLGDAVKVTVTNNNTSTPLEDAFTVTEELESGITYQGWAAAGCAGTGDAKFSIKKIFRIGVQTFEIWAEGNTNFDKVWDNRAIYAYPFQIK